MGMYKMNIKYWALRAQHMLNCWKAKGSKKTTLYNLSEAVTLIREMAESNLAEYETRPNYDCHKAYKILEREDKWDPNQ